VPGINGVTCMIEKNFRPKNEKPYMILVVGYPEDGTLVPDIDKKSLQEIATFI